MHVCTWRTDASGFVCVTGADGVERVPVLGEKMASKFDAKVLPWEPLAIEAGEPHGVAAAYILATVHNESLGNPNAVNGEVPPGLGLTQITNPSLYRGYTRAEVLIPRINLSLCARHVRYLTEHAEVADVPCLASMYNAGATVAAGNKLRPHPSALNAWGMRCSGAYISGVVAAHNYYLGKLHSIEGVTDPFDDESALSLVARTSWDLVASLLDADRRERRTLPD